MNGTTHLGWLLSRLFVVGHAYFGLELPFNPNSFRVQLPMRLHAISEHFILPVALVPHSWFRLD